MANLHKAGTALFYFKFCHSEFGFISNFEIILNLQNKDE